MVIKLNNTEVGNFLKPYIIAEVGSNHNGDIDLAKKLITAAKEAGANCVKFQSWSPDSLIAEEEYQRNQVYNDSPKKHFGSLRAMCEKYYLRREQHFELNNYCIAAGIQFISTPFSLQEVDLLEEINVPFYKVASMDINNIDLLKYVASKKKPVVLSTGMATFGEIDNAVKIIEHEGNNEIVILHCIAVYPPKYKDINLRNITTLMEMYDYPIGFSDHSIGSAIPLASVALGSCLIEKHFTLNKDMDGWDHAVSADPEEMKNIVQESANINIALGSTKRIISDDEKAKKIRFRRSVVIKKDLQKGHILSEEDFTYKRPGEGIQPDEKKYILGRKIIKDIKADELIKWSDLQE